jgi:leucyl-tRNA synthetase
MEAMRVLLLLLNPMAPHVTEELWERLGFAGRISSAAWPTWNDAYLVESEVELVVQVNGKIRDKFVVARDATREQVEALALASPRIQDWTAGLTVKKVVVVPGKLVNLVVG